MDFTRNHALRLAHPTPPIPRCKRKWSKLSVSCGVESFADRPPITSIAGLLPEFPLEPSMFGSLEGKHSRSLGMRYFQLEAGFLWVSTPTTELHQRINESIRETEPPWALIRSSTLFQPSFSTTKRGHSFDHQWKHCSSMRDFSLNKFLSSLISPTTAQD